MHADLLFGKGILPTMESSGVQAAVDAAGGYRSLARLLGITHQAIIQWEKVPASRMLEIERLTGVQREVLRPDLYRRRRETA
jgi:DNA-binding transcriptional regulator YdaS (Cro superfamily)